MAQVLSSAPGGWRVLSASERGVSHQALGLPNQDAVTVRNLAAGGTVAAVADGHGDRRHFRSGRGAELAATHACEIVAQQEQWLAGLTGTAQAEEEVLTHLVPKIIRSWRDSVHSDAAAHPLTSEEDAFRRDGDDVEIAYGTTLLLAVVWDRWLLLAQIGDGDIVGIGAGGQALLPVPIDPLLDGHHTTSLCSPVAQVSFRSAALDLTGEALLGVLLATDGYGNAQAAQDWEQGVSAGLAGSITGHTVDWLAAQLPTWARRCASADGSGDDTTIALMLAPGAAAETGED